MRSSRSTQPRAGLARRLQHVQQRADVHGVQLAQLASHAHARASPSRARARAARAVDHGSRSAAHNGKLDRRNAFSSTTPTPVLVEQVAAGQARRQLARHVVLEQIVQHSLSFVKSSAATRTMGMRFSALVDAGGGPCCCAAAAAVACAICCAAWSRACWSRT